MENKDLFKLIMETSKVFSPKGPKGPKGPGGPGGPPPEKKFLMLLNICQPEQPVPVIGMMAGIPGPDATKALVQELEEQGLVIIKEEPDGDRVKRKITISDAGHAKVEADKEEFRKKMEEGKKAFIAKVDERLDRLSAEEKTALADLLQKLSEEK